MRNRCARVLLSECVNELHNEWILLLLAPGSSDGPAGRGIGQFDGPDAVWHGPCRCKRLGHETDTYAGGHKCQYRVKLIGLLNDLRTESTPGAKTKHMSVKSWRPVSCEQDEGCVA